ncbi:MAG TPA: heparin lyase I family protein, partial [Gemmatimonadales bacterium]|nr:heparin lyase I family protein [Gemmatimonadales bacterium]
IVPNGTDYFYAGLDPEENSLPTLQPFSYYTYWPDMNCCYGNMLFQQSSKTALVPGQWQEVVFHVKLNTIGQADGLQEVWIDGVKKLSQQNMRWRTTTDVRLNEIRFDNYMGGGSPITEHVWLDDVTVWRP